MRLVIASILVAAACSSPSKPPAPVTPPPAAEPAAPAPTPAPAPEAAPTTTAGATKVTLADVGLEPASMDRSIDPCVDFYQFACGGWMQANQIPADRARWARFSEIDERNKAAIRSLLEEDA